VSHPVGYCLVGAGLKYDEGFHRLFAGDAVFVGFDDSFDIQGEGFGGERA
jgi:hypothetical protein